MSETGESYQQALARLREERERTGRAPRDVDLLDVDYFGARITLATFEILERLACVMIPNRAFARPATATKSPFFALTATRTLH